MKAIRTWLRNRELNRLMKELMPKELPPDELQRLLKDERVLCQDCEKRRLIIRELRLQLDFYLEALKRMSYKPIGKELEILSEDAKTYRLVPVEGRR